MDFFTNIFTNQQQQPADARLLKHQIKMLEIRLVKAEDAIIEISKIFKDIQIITEKWCDKSKTQSDALHKLQNRIENLENSFHRNIAPLPSENLQKASIPKLQMERVSSISFLKK